MWVFRSDRDTCHGRGCLGFKALLVEESCQAEDGSYDFSGLFANVKDEVQAADIAIVNQEVIIGGEELGVSGYPSFNAPYEVADTGRN